MEPHDAIDMLHDAGLAVVDYYALWDSAYGAEGLNEALKKEDK
jgi:hypothetical protein